MKVLSFGDTHFPFEDKKALSYLYKFVAKRSPDIVVHNGDLNDNYMFGKYDIDFNIIKPKDERAFARARGQEMWRKMGLVCEAKRYQLIGNHDIRVAKSIMRCIPTLSSEISTIRKVYYTFDGVETFKSDRDYIVFDDVVYTHGWMTGCCAHKNHFKKSVVHGHSHHPDKEHDPMRKTDYKDRWEMDTGTFCDPKKAPFGYTNSTLTGWKPAIGWVVDGRPELILL